MPTLAQYLTAKLAAFGYVPSDVSLVEWDSGVVEFGDFGWLPVDRSQFLALAQQDEAANVLEDARVRLRFTLQKPDPASPQRRVVWDPDAGAGGDFVLFPEDPGIVVLTAADLFGP